MSVIHIVRLIINYWGKGKYKIKKNIKFKEQKNLSLNIIKAKKILRWKITYNTQTGIRKTIQWYFDVVKNKKNPAKITNDQISEYMQKSNLK